MRIQVEEAFRRHNDGFMDDERIKLYRGLKWSNGTVDLKDVGIWDEAQGMPHEWCVGNILETAEHYTNGNRKHGFFRDKIKYLINHPSEGVIVVNGRLKRGRLQCEETKWSVDDGCMRTLSAVLKGEKEITCFKGETL